MPTATTEYFEELPNDECVEWKIQASFTSFDPGRCSGPPENCYPSEGGELLEISAERNSTDFYVDGKPIKVVLFEEQMRKQFGEEEVEKLIEELAYKASYEQDDDFYDDGY